MSCYKQCSLLTIHKCGALGCVHNCMKLVTILPRELTFCAFVHVHVCTMYDALLVTARPIDQFALCSTKRYSVHLNIATSHHMRACRIYDNNLIVELQVKCITVVW